MPLTYSSTWFEKDGTLSDVVRVTLADGKEEKETDTRIELHQPVGGGSCIVVLQGALQQEPSAITVISNARTCEVSVQYPGDPAPSYVTTVRALAAGATWYKADVSIKDLLTFEQLHLKLLSLQGDKTICSIREIAVVCAKQQQAVTTSSGSADYTSAPPAVLSQMDEVRLLNASMMQQGLADAADAVPASLQLLMSKALQQPTNGDAATSMKALSAQFAKGMLMQHRVQQQQEQRRQQQQSGPSAMGLSAAASPPSGHQLGEQTPADNNIAGSATGSPASEVLLQAVARLESKIDMLADQLLTAMQQLDVRLASLEAHCSAAAAP